jgi:hypothetical protein
MCELTENSAAGASDQESIAYLKLVLKNMVDEVIVPFDEEPQDKKAGEKAGDASSMWWSVVSGGSSFISSFSSTFSFSPNFQN